MVTIKNALSLLVVDGRFVLGMSFQSRNQHSCQCSC